MLRNLGYKQDKLIENKAFVAADRQRTEEQVMKKAYRQSIELKKQKLHRQKYGLQLN